MIATRKGPPYPREHFFNHYDAANRDGGRVRWDGDLHDSREAADRHRHLMARQGAKTLYRIRIVPKVAI